MRPFAYRTAPDDAAASTAVHVLGNPARSYLAGGTTLLDLMKLDVMRPSSADRHQRPGRRTRRQSKHVPGGLRLGALARMADVADHPACAGTIPSSPNR